MVNPRRAAVLGVVGLGLIGCGLAQLPDHWALCGPDSTRVCGGTTPANVCRARDPKPATPSNAARPIAWDWQRRVGEAFATSEVTAWYVLAKHANAGWTAEQLKTFPFDPSIKGRSRAIVPIGGDYWQNTPYPVAPEGTTWASSAFRAPSTRGGPAVLAEGGDALRGELASVEFTIGEHDVLHVAIGGASAKVGLELQVDGADGGRSSCARRARPLGGGFSCVLGVTPRGGEPLVPQRPIPLAPWRGRRARLIAFDDAEDGHVNVAASLSSDAAPVRVNVQLWGLADYHTHPSGHVAFGGLQGIPTFWGAPGGAIKDYQGPTPQEKYKRNMMRDIPPCGGPGMRFNGHQGGLASALLLSVNSGRASEALSDLAVPALADQHGSQGAPTYKDFPDFRSGIHQTYHITQIHRAYLGGLRLMSALAMQTGAYEYAAGWVTCGSDGKPTVATTPDAEIIRAHVQVMRELEELNGDWMEIAYTPEDAREIIRKGKLAIVLGVEVDQLGELEWDHKPHTVDEELDWLVGLGIRQVTFIHAIDNVLGGPTLFVDLYNSANDWANRKPELRDKVEPLSGFLNTHGPFGPAAFFVAESAPWDGDETVRLRLNDPLRIVLSDVFPHPSLDTHAFPLLGIQYGIMHPLIAEKSAFATERGVYDAVKGGHRNHRGLTARGREYVAKLMQRGMLVDIAHASENAISRVDPPAWCSAFFHDRLDANAIGRPRVDADGECGGVLETAKGIGCGDYPLMISHAHHRALGMKADYSDQATTLQAKTASRVQTSIANIKTSDPSPSMTACIRHGKCDARIKAEAVLASRVAPLGPGTTIRGNLTNEYLIKTEIIEEVNRRDGVIGIFLGQYPIDATALRDLPFANDCAGSSKGFAVAYWFGLELKRRASNRGGIGFASDKLMVPDAAPRFGENACAAYLSAGKGSDMAGQILETLVNPGQFRFDDQESPVTYTVGTETCSGGNSAIGKAVCYPNAPLEPYIMGDRTFDFNVDGLAHYGLVPDMLQDVHNVMNPTQGPHAGGPAHDLGALFESAEAYVAMWETARSLADCKQSGRCDLTRPVLEPATTCRDACPKSWNGGAPLEELQEILASCDAGQPIHLTQGDGDVEIVHASRPPGRLDAQGDWAVYRTLTRQLWRCGDTGRLQSIGCPEATNYVKVRRVLDAQIGDIEDCNNQPLRPGVGNRRVVFQCLIGPTEDRYPRRQK